mgnify:CR=1
MRTGLDGDAGVLCKLLVIGGVLVAASLRAGFGRSVVVAARVAEDDACLF